MELIVKIKELIIETLNLEDISISDIDASAPLFGDGLGLDSIDALEIGIAIKKQYGVEIKGNADQQHFASVEALAAFIATKQVA